MFQGEHPLVIMEQVNKSVLFWEPISNLNLAFWWGCNCNIYSNKILPKGHQRYRSNQVKLFQKQRKVAPKLRQKGNYLISDKREMCLFSPPDCVGQGDHGNSFLSISNEVSSEYLPDSQHHDLHAWGWKQRSNILNNHSFKTVCLWCVLTYPPSLICNFGKQHISMK